MNVTIDSLASILSRLVVEREQFISDQEGHDPFVSHGCMECTVGTVPHDLNTGLCPYHSAKLALYRLRVAHKVTA